MYKMKLSNLQKLGIIALFLSITIISVMPATAAAVSVTRDLPDAVSPGAEFKVSLNQSGFYFTGSVTETLPEGFSYRGVLSGGTLYEYDETTNDLTMDFQGGATTLIYRVKAGTAEQIEAAVFSGTWNTFDSQMNKISGSIEGETRLTLAVPTPAPTPAPTPTPAEAPPSGGGGGGGGGGGAAPLTIPPAPPAETHPYIDLSATPAEIPADGTSTSTITAFVWNGEDWVMGNLTVNFSTSLGTIPASAPVVNGSATGTLTAGTEEGSANVTAEANLPDVGSLTNTTAVTFTRPSVTSTPTTTPGVTSQITPMVTPTATPTPSLTPAEGIPGFEAVFAIAGLLAVAYLVRRRRKA
jgi:PGF-CTERM protein